MLNRLLGIKSTAQSRGRDRPAEQPSGQTMNSLFAQLQRHDSALRGCLQMRTLCRGQHLFRPADTRSCVYSVYAGTLKSYRALYNGNEKITGFHFPGEVLGLEAVCGRPLRRGAVALNPATVFMIPVPMVIEHLGRCALTRAELLGRFYSEIIELEEHLSLDDLSAEQRLAAFVLWAADKLAARTTQRAVVLPMPQKDIGNYLGLVPETVSRLLARFQERGWLSLKQHSLTVQNWQRLREAAAGLACGPDSPTAAGAEHAPSMSAA